MAIIFLREYPSSPTSAIRSADPSGGSSQAIAAARSECLSGRYFWGSWRPFAWRRTNSGNSWESRERHENTAQREWRGGDDVISPHSKSEARGKCAHLCGRWTASSLARCRLKPARYGRSCRTKCVVGWQGPLTRYEHFKIYPTCFTRLSLT
jgi:hypothetical protein